MLRHWLFSYGYGSQVNMILTWLPRTLWHSHICQKVLQNRRFQFGRYLLNPKRLCSFIQAELFHVACLRLQEPRTEIKNSKLTRFVTCRRVACLYIQSARKTSSCLARQNEFHKSFNNGTFSRFKRFHIL